MERLFTVYKLAGNVLYGSMYPLQIEDSQAPKIVPLGQWESPFIVSVQLGEREVTPGSIPYHMHEALRPLLRTKALRDGLTGTLPSHVRESIVESRSGNTITYTSDAFSPAFIYRQDETVRDGVLLSALSTRTLMDIFSGKGNRLIPAYDYDGNRIDGVLMQRLFNALSHHRYCAVSNGFICDIFSDQDVEGLPDMFGVKIKAEELATETVRYLEELTINDFVGMLRGRLERLTVDSKTRDKIFVHQNICALTDIVAYRIPDPQFAPFLDFVLEPAALSRADELLKATADRPVESELRFFRPRFKLGSDLGAKIIEMHVTFSERPEESEMYEFSQQVFFEKLTDVCGHQAIIPIQELVQQIENLTQPS